MSALMTRELTGPPDKVGARLDALNRAGLVVTIGQLHPHPDGMSVLVVLRKPAALQGDARQLPAARQAWSTRQLTATQRRLAIRGGFVAGGLAALAAGVWLIVRAISSAFSGAASWVAGNRMVAVLVGFGLAAWAVAWLFRDRSGKTSGACPGMVHHCARCPDHR